MQLFDPAPRPLAITLNIPVGTYDIDFAGIVSNIVYIRWLEDLRIKLLEEHFPPLHQKKQAVFPVLSETQVTYKRPIRLLDQVTGNLWMGNLKRLKWTTHAEILCNDEVAAIATQTGAFVDFKTIRPVPIPVELSQKFLAFQREHS